MNKFSVAIAVMFFYFQMCSQNLPNSILLWPFNIYIYQYIIILIVDIVFNVIRKKIVRQLGLNVSFYSLANILQKLPESSNCAFFYTLYKLYSLWATQQQATYECWKNLSVCLIDKHTYFLLFKLMSFRQIQLHTGKLE